MKQTIQYKLDPTSEQAQALLDTMTTFSAACNDILKSELQEKTSRFDLHKRYYSAIKERYGLTPNYVVRAIARVAASIGKGKKPPEEFKSTSLALDKDLFRYLSRDETVSISTIEGRMKIRVQLDNRQRKELQGQDPQSATLDLDEGRENFSLSFLD